MYRREFLKYLLSISACSCCGCKVTHLDSDIERKINESHSISKVKNLETFEIKIPICYHCNLNCAYCSHFSPLAPKYEVPIEVFERDIKQLKKISNNKIKRISLLGGEPLLHKDIEKLIVILNKYFPKTTKRITTNATLFPKMSESFWQTCKKNNIIFKYSPYILNKNFKQNEEQILKLSKKYDIEIKKYTEDVDKFELMNLSLKTNENDKNNYKNCEKKYSCLLLDNGNLYPCEVIGSIRFFNNYFKDYALPITKNDYLDIHKTNSIKEIYTFFKTPVDFCKYCAYGKNPKTSKWKISEKKVDEWYNLNKKGQA